MSGPAPFGMRWMDGRLVQDAGEIGTVRDLVEAFVAAGGRAKTAAAALNCRSAKTRRGTPWTDVAVARVIRNSALRDLVTEDQWKRLSELLQARELSGARPNRLSAHPLGGVVRCACGGRMYFRGEGPAGKFCCRICRATVAQDTLKRVFAEGLDRVEFSAAEVLEASAASPRAAELTRIIGGQPVALSEIWPVLDPAEARQLVDLLVDRIVVGTDEVTVVFAEKRDSSPKLPPLPPDSLPSSHGSDPARRGATKRDEEKSVTVEPPRRILEPKAYRVSHVAQLLSLPRATVYDLVRTGALPSIRTGTNGGVVLVPADAVAEFLEKKKGRR